MLRKDNHNTKNIPRANRVDNNQAKTQNQVQNQNNLDPFNCHQKINNLHFSRYPFQNDELSQHQFIKTTISCQIEQSSLRKLMKISHPNLINIMKIVKGYPKQFSSPRLSGYYSFFYEQVPYSLKRFAAITECEGTIMKSIQRINFRQVLQQVTDYLFSLGIYHLIKLDDVGLDCRFQIKVYVPPTVFLQNTEKNKDKRCILKNNQNIISWWKTTFQCNNEPPIKMGSMNYICIPGQYRESLCLSPDKIKSNKSSFIVGQCSQSILQNEEERQDIEKMKISLSKQKLTSLVSSNHINKHNQRNLNSSIKEEVGKAANQKEVGNTLKYSNRSFRTELVATKNIQNNQKILKIHAEVARLKERVHKASFDYRLRKQSGNSFFQKIQGLNSSTNNQKLVFQSTKLQKTYQSTQPNQFLNKNCINEPILPKINCINIYNNSHQHKKNQNIRNQPILSYKISPIQNTKIKAKAKPVVVSYPNIQNAEDSYDSMNDSFQIGDVLVHESPLRHSLEPNEHHSNISNFRAIDKQKIISKNHIPVGTKSVTESAGPLQFKSIINNLIKPQFLSKKSNIYEQLHEDESQHSIKKQSSKAQDTTNAQNQKDSILAAMYESDTRQYRKPRQKQQKLYQMNKYIKIETMEKQMDSKGNYKKYIPHQKSYPNLNKRPKFSENALSAKVKEVLAKTKNAIDLLNRVKSLNCVNRKYLSP